VPIKLDAVTGELYWRAERLLMKDPKLTSSLAKVLRRQQSEDGVGRDLRDHQTHQASFKPTMHSQSQKRLQAPGSYDKFFYKRIMENTLQ